MTFAKPKLFSNNILRDAQLGSDGNILGTCAKTYADENNQFAISGNIVPSADVPNLAALEGCGIVFDTTLNEYRITDSQAAMRKIGQTLKLVPEQSYMISMLISGSYLYAGANTSPGVVVKIDLTTFLVAGYALLASGENGITSLAVDPAKNYIYAGLGTSPAMIAKINIIDMTEVGTALSLTSGENAITSLAIDTANQVLYAGLNLSPGKIAKINIASTPVEIGTAISLTSGENGIYALAIDLANQLLYAGLFTSTGKIAKINLINMAEVGTALALAANENQITSLAIDTANQVLYAGCNTVPGIVAKVNLATMAEVGTGLSLASGENYIWALAIDTGNHLLYAGLDPIAATGKIAKINIASTPAEVGTALALATNENHALALAIDTNNSLLYAGLNTQPGRIAKVNIASTPAEVGTALVLAVGENSIKAMAFDNVNNLLYVGLGTSPGMIVKIDLATMQQIGTTLILASGENIILALEIDTANQLLYAGLGTYPGMIAKINISGYSPVEVGTALALASGENNVFSLAIDLTTHLLYAGLNLSPAKIAKINIASTPVEVGAALALASGENIASALAIDTANQFLYVGLNTSPGKIAKVGLVAMTEVGTALSLASGENLITCLAIDTTNHLLYAGLNLSPGKIAKINIASTPAEVGTALALASGENSVKALAIDVTNQFLYAGLATSPGGIAKINLATMLEVGTAFALATGENNVYAFAFDTQNQYLYAGLYVSPGAVVTIMPLPQLTLFESLQDIDIGDSFTVRAGLVCAAAAQDNPIVYAADNHWAKRFKGVLNTAAHIYIHAPNFIENGGFETGDFTGYTVVGANWSVTSANKLEGAYSALWNTSINDAFYQKISKKVTKGKLCHFMAKVRSLTGNAQVGAITFGFAVKYNGNSLYQAISGAQPLITTTAAWVDIDIVPDFTTDNWTFQIIGDSSKKGSATGIVIDECYFYEKKTVNTLIVDHHNWYGLNFGATYVNAWRLSPLRSTAMGDANNKSQVIAGIQYDFYDPIYQAATETAWPVYEIVLPAIADRTLEAGEIYMGDYWQVPRFPGAFDPLRTNADGLREMIFNFANFLPSFRRTNIEDLFEKLRQNEAIYVVWDTDPPLLMESPRDVREAAYNPDRISWSLKLLERL